jgi:hypothetical protein
MKATRRRVDFFPAGVSVWPAIRNFHLRLRSGGLKQHVRPILAECYSATGPSSNSRVSGWTTGS